MCQAEDGIRDLVRSRGLGDVYKRQTYENWIYVIMFMIIFIETGIVIWPWLPGDSLLFAAGTFCAIGSLNIFILIPLLIIAAILGDTSNYFIGKYFGERAMKLKFRGKQILKAEHLDKTHKFYERHGAKTIILARFVPIAVSYTHLTLPTSDLV